MKALKPTVLFLVLYISLFATERKKFEESFEIEPGKLIEIRALSGMNVEVKSWNKNEVYYDLKLEVSCSDNDFEKEYVEKFNIDVRNISRGLIIEMEEEDHDNGWNFWDIFRGKFYYHFSKEITGTIIIPEQNSFQSDFRYGDIQLTDIAGEVNLLGRSNDLNIYNCAMLNTIENDYGKNRISNCGGKLTLESRSSETELTDFDGPVRIRADYADLSIKSVSGSLNISTRSAEVKVDDIGGDLDLNGDYSEIIINKVKGFVNVSSRSGNIDVSYTNGLNVESPYSDIYAYNIADSTGRDVKILAQSGKIQLESITGRVIIDDSYSGIKLKDIVGHVILESRSSNIRADNIQGNWKSETKYSSLDLRNIKAEELFIKNQSDEVNVSMKTVPKKVEIKNHYGDAILRIPGTYEGGLDLFANYGDILCDFPIRVKSEGSTSRAVSHGNSEANISIETKSGDIELIKN